MFLLLLLTAVPGQLHAGSTLEEIFAHVLSDELDFSAARRPPELILGSMSTEHTIYWS